MYHIPTASPQAMGEEAWKAFISRIGEAQRREMCIDDQIAVHGVTPSQVRIYYVEDNQPARRSIDRADFVADLVLSADVFMRHGLEAAIKQGREEAARIAAPPLTIDPAIKAAIAEEVSRQLAPLQARIATLERQLKLA